MSDTSWQPTGGVKISNVHAISSASYRHGTYTVEIRHNRKVTKKSQATKANGTRIIWPETLSFACDFTNRSIFQFTIVRTRFVHRRLNIASCEQKVLDLLQLQKNSGSCKLELSEGSQLIFTIEQEGDILPELLDEAKNTPAGRSTSENPVEVANVVTDVDANEIIVGQGDMWTSFLSQFGIFVNIVDNIAEVHPYVALAWSILSVIPKTIISQNSRNDSINKLFRKLKDVYGYITDAKCVHTLGKTQSKTIFSLVQQTIECAYFLREYGASNTASKLLNGVSIDIKINDFNDKFDHILDVMRNSTSIEINIVTLRISNDVKELREDIGKTHDLALLGGMPYAADAGFLSAKRCLPGTRENLLTEIFDWVNGSDPQRVLLLLGQAGTGKSAIAHTISQVFDKQNRLGSLFCFSRSYKDRRHRLFSTISRQLADGDVQWRRSLVRIIEKSSIKTSLDIIVQFEELIVKPSKEVNTIGPVVIVIDGLDESGDRNERAPLLELLFKRCSELPPNYYFVITSRLEPDIKRWCQQPNVICKRMADIDPSETTKDIQKYISFRLYSVEGILDKQLGVDWLSRLTRRAEGLFQWASTVCDLIDPTVEFEVAEQVKTYISGSTSSLYQLYYRILDSRPEFRRTNFLTAFNMIMSAIVAMREPLSVQALQSIFQYDIRHTVESILTPLHSLFLGIHDLHTPVRPLHTSLIDFLTTPSVAVVDNEWETETKTKTIPNPFYVDTSNQGYFTLACLKLMNDERNGLRFNICNLETSHQRNQDVSDLNHRIQRAIPSHLSYASSFWAVHLRDSIFNDALLEQLRYLMHTNLLYLFEALGLLQNIEQACISMKILAAWCEDKDRELAQQAEESCQFGYDFGDVIMISTPHLYISALPFAPENSYKQYRDLFPHHFNIEQSQSAGSLRNTHVMKRHISSTPTAVAFSPRGRHIATGFENGEFWLWDYKTGEMVYQWESDSTLGKICSIVFSPNGESVTCCFDDASIKIWNVDRNELVCHSSEGKSGSYSTISNDGRYLVFHSSENGILLYDTSTFSEPTQIGFQRRRSIVESIFSSDGKLLAFLHGSDHVSLWHIQTRKAIGSFRLTSFDRVNSMAFSPNGDYLVLGSNKIVEIWNVSTRTKIREFELDDYEVEIYRQVVFPNNQNLLVSSNHGTYIWNVLTGQLLQSLLSEELAYPLAVSADSEHIVLTTRNGVIQVQEWENMPSVIPQMSRYYTSARISPGGTYLILGLQGKETGQMYLQISNAGTMSKVNTQAQLKNSMIEVSPGDEYVAYIATHGLCLWSDKTGELVLDTSNRDFSALAFSFTGDRLIAGDRIGGVTIWNTHTRRPVKTLTPAARGMIASLAFSSTGGQFLVVSPSSSGIFHVIEIHDSPSEEALKNSFSHRAFAIPRGYGTPVVAFSANESHIVYISSPRGTVLNAKTGHISKRFTIQPPLGTLQLSPDRKYIMRVDGMKNLCLLWDIDRGVEVKSHQINCHAIGFSNNSEELIRVDQMGMIGFQNIATGNETIILTSRYSTLNETKGASVSSDERYLVFLAEGHIEVWSRVARRPASQECEHGPEFKIERSEDDHIEAPFRPDNQGRREYALIAWEKAFFSDSSKINQDGWVLGPNEELLFWVPEERRAGLWRPSLVHMAGPPIVTKLNFDNFVHGSKWTGCKKALIP